MAQEKVLVKVKSDAGSDDAYFKEQDQEKIRALQEEAAQAANAKYCEAHKDHCFRCGTRSLVEVERGDVRIDICVNEDCGAVHLDPGELEQILKDNKTISSIRKSVLSVFK